MRRYVRRGSKGIALLDTSGEKPRLRYVFDISDTGEYGKIPAVHFFGNFSRNMKRRWLKFWSRDLACLWKIIWLSSSRVLQTSLSVSIGRNTSGIFVTSLTEGYQEGEDRKNLHTSGGRSRPNIWALIMSWQPAPGPPGSPVRSIRRTRWAAWWRPEIIIPIASCRRTSGQSWENTVDYIGFSYYSSRCITTQENAGETSGNAFKAAEPLPVTGRRALTGIEKWLPQTARSCKAEGQMPVSRETENSIWRKKKGGARKDGSAVLSGDWSRQGL